MSNLIITIIGIALVAVAAVMGVFYGGTAFQNAQINATANTIINEANQILAAERIWSVNNAQTDISGMGTAGASGTGMSMLVNSKTLSQWPSFGGNIAVNTSLQNPGPQPWLGGAGSAATITTGAYDNGAYLIGGYSGGFIRFIFSYKNQNYVTYLWGMDTGYVGAFVSSTTDVSKINHPVVKIAKAINAALNQIPSNANMATMPYIGIPAPPAGWIHQTPSSTYNAVSGSSGYANDLIVTDANGVQQSNYCYFASAGPGYSQNPPYAFIVCTFGPS